MKLLKGLSYSMFFILCTFQANAQIQTPGYQAEFGSILQSGNMKPFWMISNQGGKFHPENSSLFGGIYIGSEVGRQSDFFVDSVGNRSDRSYRYEPTDRLTLDYGLEVFNRYNGEYDLRLQQYYADVSWWYFKFHAGARRETFGNQYDPLSSGSLLYSGNARPIPKVAVSSNYIPVPFTKGYIEFKGYLSHGWFEKDRYTESPYLHHKNVYVRVGGDLPINAHYGFHHYAMWGGTSPEYGDLPDSWDAYKKIFVAEKGEEENAPIEEVINSLGNHLGSRNFGLDYRAESFGLQLYWQTIFEDGSGMAWRNIEDGLGGLVYKNHQKSKPLVQKALYEFVHTTDQSGEHHRIDGEIVGGNDNYFNHFLYSSGWTTHGYTIGTPMITSPSINRKSSGQILVNNKVKAHHLGLMGWLLDNLQYRAMGTYSINYGTNHSPFEPAKRAYSLLSEFHYQLPGEPSWRLKLKLSADFGKMYGKNVGMLLGVSYSGMMAE
ncbi:MAG: capsule assembly Wzi family protein [Bacteroidota bacterium]